MNKEISNYLENFLKKLGETTFILSEEKALPYGIQLLLEKEEEKFMVNIYYSAKKGISSFVQSKKNSSLKNKTELENLLNLEKNEDYPYNTWLGSDESGKGDFFGPLVVCGFLAKKNDLDKLRKLGIKDSKLLSDEKNISLANLITKNFPENYQIISLSPSKYNELYANFLSKGKKLNELLAWMHARVCIDMFAKFSYEIAIIDKFAKLSTIKNSLSGLAKINILAKEKAESDPAVACASIIARANYLNFMQKMNQEFALEFPKGASNKVKATAKEFCQKFSKEDLSKVAKIHFKTYNEI